MSNTNNGGSAFPTNETNYEISCADTGMTLRDYFAAKAMQGLCADPNTSVSFKEIAEWSYNMADAMLEAALSAKQGEQERISELEAQNEQLLVALRYFMSAVENSSHLDARRGIMAGAFDIARATIATVERSTNGQEQSEQRAT